MDAYVGEIRPFAFGFAPKGWLACDGSLVPVRQYPALYSVLGNVYGGSGSAFNLPNLGGQAAMHAGAGPGLSPRSQGQQVGGDTSTVNASQLAAHSHAVVVQAGNPGSAGPSNAYLAMGGVPQGRELQPWPTYIAATPGTPMHQAAIPIVGGGLPHENRQPYLTVCLCICFDGLIPQRP